MKHKTCYANDDMIMEFRLFIGCVQGASLVRKAYFLDDVKDKTEAIGAAEEKARDKGKNGATAGLYAREGSTKCYAIRGWKVLGEGKLTDIPSWDVEQILQVYPADFDIPPLGKEDLEHLR